MEEIKFITSHIQALRQTENNRKLSFPNWSEQETNDTASAARNLSQGVLPDDYAVICRKNAGEKYGLKLVCENIEDDENNRTEFRVYKLPEGDAWKIKEMMEAKMDVEGKFRINKLGD